MEFSSRLNNKLIRIVNSNVTEGEFFVEHQIIPLSVDLFKEIYEKTGKPVIEPEIIEDNPETTFAMIKRGDVLSFGINRSALNNNNYGFKKGLHYAANIPQRNLRLVELITTIFHEVRHCEQFTLAQEADLTKLSSLAIIYAKELLIIAYDNEWYRQNHNSFLIEKEATLIGYGGMRDFISGAMPNTSFTERAERESAAGVKNMMPQIKRYFDNPNGVSFCDEISKRVDMLARSGNIDYMLKEFPAIGIIYNNDGSKKSLAQIRNNTTNFRTQNKSILTQTQIIDGIELSVGANLNNILRNIIKSDADYKKENQNSVAPIR